MTHRTWYWLALTGLLAGCADTLDTGYAPTRLSATANQRPAHYAAPYSPEAQAGDEKGAPDVAHHTPGSVY